MELQADPQGFGVNIGAKLIRVGLRVSGFRFLGVGVLGWMVFGLRVYALVVV